MITFWKSEVFVIPENYINYIIPTVPAVNPTATKKTNSSKSLGKEFTIRLNWVIWPCAPQVYKLKKI